MLNCKIDSLTLRETVAEIDRLIMCGSPVQHCFINAHMAVMLGRDARLRELVEDCALVNVDGQAVVWTSRLLGRPLPERVAGPDLFSALIELAEQRSYSVYFLGARQQVVSAMVERLSRAHPTLQVAGWRNGYWSPGGIAGRSRDGESGKSGHPVRRHHIAIQGRVARGEYL